MKNGRRFLAPFHLFFVRSYLVFLSIPIAKMVMLAAYHFGTKVIRKHVNVFLTKIGLREVRNSEITNP